MTRSRHTDKDLEAVLREAEDKGWRVEKGKYWKLLCPNSCKCMKTVKLTPSGANYLTNLRGQLKRATCWDGGEAK